MKRPILRFEPVPHPRYLGSQWVVFVGWLLVSLTAFLLRPSVHGHGTHQQLGLPPCGSVLIFGRPCPGCGLTTSFAASVKGDLLTAWNANPFGTIFYLAFTVSAIVSAWGLWKRAKPVPDGRWFNPLVAALIVSYLLYGVWRFFFERATYAPEPPLFNLPKPPWLP